MKKNVLIVGGGFGGIKAALELAKEPEDFDVTLLSEHEHFRYFPELFHTATGGLRTQTSIRIRGILEGKGVTFIKGKADKLHRETKQLETTAGQKLNYDVLILSLGVVTNYFGIKGLKEYSFGIKSPEEAAELKAELHRQLTDEHEPDKNYVIVGAGPTGIELAGALPGYMEKIMAMHGTKRKKVHID
jgi:NADH dehydrogenase